MVGRLSFSKHAEKEKKRGSLFQERSPVAVVLCCSFGLCTQLLEENHFPFLLNNFCNNSSWISVTRMFLIHNFSDPY